MSICRWFGHLKEVLLDESVCNCATKGRSYLKKPPLNNNNPNKGRIP